ncbi:MAG: DUF1223 domain-containing protein [Hyphomicrobiales bacterium]|nr:DUF1223 domain-containing protein [Hyphomicrobiales bacterium]MDE2285837.1 DUF1223 domain-containing protein [Hyphomicrobiales bacterium]
MRRRRLLSASLVAGLVIASCMQANAGEHRALIELFTSQGCSSCPAADKLLGELASDPSVVALSLPIDYWDYLGWKDTLASPGHSARQRAYARMRGDREVYTPQIVVNGAVHVLGSDKAAVEHAIAQTDRNAAIMSVPVLTSIDGDNLNVEIAAGSDHAGAEVWLCPITRAVAVSIGRGENRGRKITYHDVVRSWSKLGDYDGSDETFTVPLAAITAKDGDAVAIMVQQGTKEKPGIILGTALLPITPQAAQHK